MTTWELLEELSKKSENEIELCLTALMVHGKFKFTNVNAAYVNYLEQDKEDSLMQLIEAETCVMQSFMYPNKTSDKKKEMEYKATQRALQCLNDSPRFNAEGLNEEYRYDAEFAKELSLYQQHKRNRL